MIHITCSGIDALIPRIELLRNITERVCRDRSAGYCQLSNKKSSRQLYAGGYPGVTR